LAHSLDREPVPSPRREIEAEEVSHMLALLSVATKDVPGVLRSKQGRSIGVPWAKKLGSCAWNGFPFALTSRGSEICSVGVLYLALLALLVGGFGRGKLAHNPFGGVDDGCPLELLLEDLDEATEPCMMRVCHLQAFFVGSESLFVLP
jgi:hypothetical protein